MAPSKEVNVKDESSPLLRKSQTEEKVRWGARHTLALLGFFGITIEYCQRVNLSVAIIAMVAPNNSSKASSESFCPIGNISNNTPYTEAINKEYFDWDKTLQGVVLGAFFWGYASTNFIGGRLAEYVGGKMVFGIGIVASSLITLSSPLSANASVELFIACRILLGLVQGVTFPSMNSMLATWILPADRSTFSTIVYSGFQVGTVIGLMATGWLCNLKTLGGWPFAFYVFGVLGIIWGIVWYCMVYERPEDHPGISSAELSQLLENYESVKMAEVLAVPWKSVLTSLPFLAILIGNVGNDFGFYTLLTELPTYLHDVQHFAITNNGILSALPYLLMWVWSLLWAALMNFLTHKDKLSIVNVRRVSMAVALYGPMLGLIGMCFVYCNATLAVIVLCIFGMFNGAVNSGFLCSPQDIAPNFAGTLLGATNTFGALSGIAAPAITGFIIGENGTLWRWRTVFLISAALYLINCTFYIIFISADLQPWNKSQTLPRKDDKNRDSDAEYQPIDQLEK